MLVGDSPDGGRCVLIGWRFLVLVGDRFMRWAVYAHRLACLLVLVGDRFRRWAVCAHRLAVPGVGG